MELPELCIGICTYKRPQYAALTINCLRGWLGYNGPRRFHIADGGSPQHEIDHYLRILKDERVTVEVTDNLADMCNSVAHHGGDVWITCLDDFCLRYPINITPDVGLLLDHPEIGCVRMARLAFWGAGHGPETSADLVSTSSGLHWWRYDKERTKDPYSSSIGFHLYHRRFWDAYGDIPSCPPDVPGQGELNGCARYNSKPGPTIAVPMRFGEDCEFNYEPVWHMGMWRTDEYTGATGTRL